MARAAAPGHRSGAEVAEVAGHDSVSAITPGQDFLLSLHPDPDAP